MMYRGSTSSSPLFDVPEFPTLRRVKPLPKRRRTSDGGSSHVRLVNVNPSSTLSSPPASLSSLPTLSQDATTEEILAHADALSAQMALQSYYMPMLGGGGRGGAQDPFTGSNNDLGNRGIEFNTGRRGGMFSQEEDEDHGDGDYIDHLQPHGNTKKRKVPANASSSPHGHSGHDTGSGSGGEDEATTTNTERSIPTRFDHHDNNTEGSLLSSQPTFMSSRQGQGLGLGLAKMSAVTRAGLQHKEMLKNRKRQLAAVLGALSHGDTLALDQALSANYPFAAAGLGGSSGGGDSKNTKHPKIRFSQRLSSRIARAHKALPSSSGPVVAFSECDFTFSCPSATSERLIATKEEVAMLRSRFEAELARQAAKAHKLAAANKLISSSLPQKGRSKRAEQRARTLGGKGGDQSAEFLDQTLSAMKGRGGKKKKRSAMANASNPHHLRNYVPSRLPHSGQSNNNNNNNITQTQNYLGLFPLRFLSAEIPPRNSRRKKNTNNTQGVVTPISQLANPTDEWICPFCEYELFFGDDQDYRRAVRLRKKILRRRRRARERAAAAASGNSTAKGAERSTSSHEEYDAGFNPAVGDFVAGTKPTQTKWKGDPNRDGIEKGDHHLHSSFG